MSKGKGKKSRIKREPITGFAYEKGSLLDQLNEIEERSSKSMSRKWRRVKKDKFHQGQLPPWAQIIMIILISGILILRFIPKQILYISIIIVSIIVIGLSYFIYKKRGIEPFKSFIKKIYEGHKKMDEGWRKEQEKLQKETSKVPMISEIDRGRLLNAVGNRCENPNCNHTDSLDIHHIIPRAQSGSNKLSNLIVLCPNCHRKADRGVFNRGQVKSWISRPKRFRFHLKWKW